MSVAQYGRNAKAMFDVENPECDWAALANGMGVPGTRVYTMERFVQALSAGIAGSERPVPDRGSMRSLERFEESLSWKASVEARSRCVSGRNGG
ncbi:MAG: hypothetical protein GDA40_11115 [Rhodobacteraceae bacterium]|nr:hypothetical protein [Paracoccaceae bacterium]